MRCDEYCKLLFHRDIQIPDKFFCVNDTHWDFFAILRQAERGRVPEALKIAVAVRINTKKINSCLESLVFVDG